jgi:hypothetical protein
MPRSRAVYVKPVQIIIPADWRGKVETAAAAIDRSVTWWIESAARDALIILGGRATVKQSELSKYDSPGKVTDRLNVELPGATVDAIRRSFGQKGASRFLRFAIARGLGID